MTHVTLFSRRLAAGPRRLAFLGTCLLAGVVMAACSSVDPPSATGDGHGSQADHAGRPTTTQQLPPVTAPPPHGSSSYPAKIITPRRNLPDPDVIQVPGGYELYASQTSIRTPVLPTAFSTDPTRWPPVHASMPSVPPWAINGFLWAPDVRYIGGQYVMYFDSIVPRNVYDRAEQTGLGEFAQCIGTATSDRPGGPFVGSILPLVCDFFAHGAIDPRTFVASDGTIWLDWKSDTNANTPAPYAPTTIYAQQLSADGLRLAGPPHVLMRADSSWQQNIVEAPDMVEVRGKYWLFYSGSWFNQPSYGIGIASCAGPTGPCTNLSKAGPWLGTNSQGAGPGEEAAFEDRRGDWWLLYSPWAQDWNGYTFRPIAMAALAFGARGPYVAASPKGAP
ncbi:MAG TPA: glycoside hydrolase family 43 protein [Acidimicrobiales bacterium]|jgi:beta-xylosidase|nr:glycoside hydrolase family 43 protein [Acidimicrobiales bacterium]